MSEEPEGISTTRRNMLKTGAALGGGGLLAGCSGDGGESGGEGEGTDGRETDTQRRTETDKPTTGEGESTANISPGEMPGDLGSMSNNELAYMWFLADDYLDPSRGLSVQHNRDRAVLSFVRETEKENIFGEEDIESSYQMVLDSMEADPNIEVGISGQNNMQYFEGGAPRIWETDTPYDFELEDTVAGFPVFQGESSNSANEELLVFQGEDTLIFYSNIEGTSIDDVKGNFEWHIGLAQEEGNPMIEGGSDLNERPDLKKVLEESNEAYSGVIAFGYDEPWTTGSFQTADGSERVEYETRDGEAVEFEGGA